MSPARLLVIALCFAACTADLSAPLLAADVIVTRPLPGAMVSAGYMTLINDSDEVVSITSVASPQFGSVEMHETIIEDGIARMRPIEALVIAPGSTVKFERGGKHLMLMQPSESSDTVTLNFYSGDLLVLSVNSAPDRH